MRRIRVKNIKYIRSRIMKKLKIFAVIMTVFMLFTACTAAEKEIVPEYDPNAKADEIDLLGYEFIIAALSHGGQYPLNPESGSTARADQLLQRYKETEEKYNVEITLIDGCDTGRYQTLLAADMKYADLMFTVMHHVMRGPMQQGLYMPFSDMNIDLHSGLYGTPGSLEAGLFGDDYYAIIAYYWGFPAADTMPAMWFNPAVISEYQQASPHELYENGEWTWDKLESMCEAIRDTSDPDENMHTYALAYTSEPYLEFAALFSNNARFVQKGADGKLSYALNSPEAIEALTFVRSLAERQLICDGGDRPNITPFVENRRAFFVEFTHLGLSDEGRENLAYRMESAYEWIVFPEGPSANGSKSRTSFSYNSRFFYAPINTDPEVQAILLPYMFQPLPGDTTETWQDDFERSTFFSTASFEHFQTIRDEAFFDYTIYTPFSGALQTNLLGVTRGKKAATEALVEIENEMQASLDNLYNNYME